MPQNKKWIVTTSADRPIKDIAQDLEKAGFTVASVLDDIQSITGSAVDGAEGKLRSVAGVVDIAPDAPVDVGPPDSPETW